MSHCQEEKISYTFADDQPTHHNGQSWEKTHTRMLDGMFRGIAA